MGDFLTVVYIIGISVAMWGVLYWAVKHPDNRMQYIAVWVVAVSIILLTGFLVDEGYIIPQPSEDIYDPFENPNI